MKKYKQTEGVNTNEYIIRRPLYLPIFYLLMLLSFLALWLWNPSPDGSFEEQLLYTINKAFYLIFGFSFWIPTTIIALVLFAMNCYTYFRFKLVIHEQSFSVTPFFGATHDVAFSSVETITQKAFAKLGHYIEIIYDNKKIRIPYTVNMKGVFRQSSIAVLLKKFENHKTAKEEMEFRIEKMDRFRIVGFSTSLSKEYSEEHEFEVYKKLWAKAIIKNYKLDAVATESNTTSPLAGWFCVKIYLEGDDNWRYMIGPVSSKPLEKKFDEYTIPALTWAIFPGKNAFTGEPTDDSEATRLEQRILTEWLPSSDYELVSGPVLQRILSVSEYFRENMGFPFELWFPIQKK